MQTNVISSTFYESTGIQNYIPRTTSNETLHQISNVANTQGEHTVNIPSASSSETQRSLLCSVRSFFSPSSSASTQKATPEELMLIEKGKSLVQKSDKLMQQNQQYNNFSFSSPSSCGWKTIFGLGLIAGASVSCGAFLLARQQNNVMPGNSCPSNDSLPLSPYSMPLPPVVESTTEGMQFRSNKVRSSKKVEALAMTINATKPIKSMRKNARGDFFKQTKVCNELRTEYKDCHVKHIDADNYQEYCFLYSKNKPCKRPEDINKPVVRVVEPQKDIGTRELKIKQKVKSIRLDNCIQKNSLCIPYPLEKNPETYIQKCYNYETETSCMIQLKDYETV